MNIDEAKRILDIDGELSRETVRRAYSEKARLYHPEEHPEEFQRIHDAYDLLNNALCADADRILFGEDDVPNAYNGAAIKFEPSADEYVRNENGEKNDLAERMVETLSKPVNKYSLNLKHDESESDNSEQVWGEGSLAMRMSNVEDGDALSDEEKFQKAEEEEALKTMSSILGERHASRGIKRFKAFAKENGGILKDRHFCLRLATLIRNNSFSPKILMHVFKYYKFDSIDFDIVPPEGRELYEMLNAETKSSRVIKERVVMVLTVVMTFLFFGAFTEGPMYERILPTLICTGFSFLCVMLFIFAIVSDKQWEWQLYRYDAEKYYDRTRELMTVIFFGTAGLIALYVKGFYAPDLIFMSGKLLHMILIVMSVVFFVYLFFTKANITRRLIPSRRKWY